jgi:hypothetical protein
MQKNSYHTEAPLHQALQQKVQGFSPLKNVTSGWGLLMRPTEERMSRGINKLFTFMKGK